MTESEIKSPLIDFKNQLDSLKPMFEEKLKVLEEKGQNLKKLDKEFDALIKENGNTLITLDVGGKHFKTKLRNLVSQRDSLFYVYFTEEHSTGKPLTTHFSFDRSGFYFTLILEFLRTNVLNTDNMPDNMLNDLKREVEFYGIWNAHSTLNYLTSKVEIVAFTSSGRYSNAGKHTLEELSDPNGNGGICVQSPYEITFELNRSHTLKGLKIKGWDKNTSLWGSSNGEGASIHVSDQKVGGNSKSVGTIPSGFGSTVKEVLFKEPVIGKFVRFKHTSYLGIGYIELFK